MQYWRYRFVQKLTLRDRETEFDQLRVGKVFRLLNEYRLSKVAQRAHFGELYVEF